VGVTSEAFRQEKEGLRSIQVTPGKIQSLTAKAEKMRNKVLALVGENYLSTPKRSKFVTKIKNREGGGEWRNF